MLSTQTKYFLTYRINVQDPVKSPPKCFFQKLKRLLGHFPRNQQWRLATLLCLERLSATWNSLQRVAKYFFSLQKLKITSSKSEWNAKGILKKQAAPIPKYPQAHQDFKGAAASMATRRLHRSEPSISPMKPGKILSDAHVNPEAKSATTSELLKEWTK